MNRKVKASWRLIMSGLLVLLLLSGMFWLLRAPVQAAEEVSLPEQTTAVTDEVRAPAATNWCVAGDFQGWNNNSTPIYDDGSNGDLIAGDGVYSLDVILPTAGRQEFKAVECGVWANAFPSDNAWLVTANDSQTVKLTFDTNNYSANAGAVFLPQQNIVNVWGDTLPTSFTAVGPWQGWNNTAVTTTLSDIGSGIYRLAYEFANAGSYEAKIVQTGSWDNQFGTDGRNKNAPTIPFSTTGANQTVIFLLDVVAGRVSITPNGSSAGAWCAAGDFQGWNNASTPLYDDGSNGDLLGGDGVFSRDVVVDANGRYEFKAVECGNWDVGFPSNNAWLFTTVPSQTVKITFDTNNHSGDAGLPFRPTQNIVNAWDDMPASFTMVGPWQGWANDNPATAMTALGNGAHILTYTFDAGNYEAKASTTGDWGNQVGSDGRNINAPTIPFTVNTNGDVVSFLLDGRTGRLAAFIPAPLLPPIDPALIRAPISHTVQDEVFYFALTDRYKDGDPTNNTGGIPGGPTDHGYDPTDISYYHGGDLSGLAAAPTLDYIEGLGVSAIWITPVFENNPTQPDSTATNGIGAAYHGYWILDYETADPHLGTDQELVAFINAAHARGIKVYFDFVANHTGDLINYVGGASAYRYKEDYPYRDANGVAFDDRDYIFGLFPALDPAVSFPYVPQIAPANANRKAPAWLNNPIYYHNRGDSTFAGESSTYGDFFGLDDLFTEQPFVVAGFTDILTSTIATYDVDGYRMDTVKHVNIEFWQQVIPAVMVYATNNGKPDFFIFGEVFDGSAANMSQFTTQGAMPSVLDFGLHGAARNFAVNGGATDNLRNLYANDDYFTDADSNAYQLGTFVSNHDGGIERLGHWLRQDQGGASDAELVARMELGHALLFFGRGFPVLYYGDEQGFVGGGSDKLAREDMFASQVAAYNGDLIGTDDTVADDNFDATHPLYQSYADLAAVRDAHLALRRGAQIHRYSQDSAGIYAFSRIERGEKVEYVVALNNATIAQAADVPVYTADMGFTAVYPPTATVITSTQDALLNVSVPALSAVVYRANAPLPTRSPADAPDVTFTTPAPDSTVNGRVEVGVNLSAPVFAEVNFSVKIGAGPYEYIGTDNNAPYRIFYDVSGIPVGTPLIFQAIVNDLNGGYKNNIVNVVVGQQSVPGQEDYAIIHYYRPAGDYGDFTSSNWEDFWGLHLWGDAIDPSEVTEWTSPKPFAGFDDFGAFVAIKLQDINQPINFIIHRGNDKDTPADRSFEPSETPEIWLIQGDTTNYPSRAEAMGETLVHYNRPDGIYTDWGLHLWQDGAPPLTNWPDRELPSSYDDFGAVYSITTNIYPTLEVTRGLNFIVHNGAGVQEPQRTYTPTVNYEIWVNSGEDDWYGQQGAATDTATIHYHRCLGDFGDYSSSNFNDFWGLHLWTGALTPTQWTEPLKPIGQDAFGVVFEVALQPDAASLNYILHRGDEKDTPADQSLNLVTKGYEIWIVNGDVVDENGIRRQITSEPIAFSIANQVCAGATIGNIDQQMAHWLTDNTIGWSPLVAADQVFLHAAPTGGLILDENGISGGAVYTLTQNGVIAGDIAAKFPHLAGIPAWELDAADATNAPELLKGQIAVSAFAGGDLVDATGLQIPGVLDDLYADAAYGEQLGPVWIGGTPALKLWAPTAKSVTLHIFDDANPATTSITQTMVLNPDSGIWSLVGPPNWKNKYYLYEVEVYVHSTGEVEHNIVTDPYSYGLAMNSTRSQLVNLADSALKPVGWDALVKPPLVNPEDISVYEVHVRDFSVSDPLVLPQDRGTFKAFTYMNSYGMLHLRSLADAGLTHLHLLPVFDIATINEDKSTWQQPDFTGADMGPASPDQQAAVTAVADTDAFNWGYDPFHYTVPEGSYSTVPTGTMRIFEFRQMVQSLNQNDLRVVMDVVYNHTNASGQSSNSVLDKVVPGYYHRLNGVGSVETSTCCQNTATEHDMMEKLMVDSIVTWAKYYKVDAFRFDLMGHHMKDDMLAVRAALDALTLENDGVDGSAIYVYGEGWNFGEVANNARGVNATQLNMAGTGIGTFSDRLRDAVRGPSPFASGLDLQNQGFANGLYYDPNSHPQGDALARLLLLSDQIRIGLAGNLADYEFTDRNGNLVTGAQVDYNGQPTGYTADPQEHIVYISKHDNQTLYDINAYALPLGTSMADRVRVQQMGLSIVSLSQGVPFFHAGSDLLRSKSLDRDSYNSGDWFNKLDFTYASSNWGVGLPVAGVNSANWFVMEPLLSNPALKPNNAAISQSAALYQEWLAIRSSSPLFRLTTAADVQARLTFENVGPNQIPGLIVMNLADLGAGITDLDPSHDWIVVLFNANDVTQTISSTAWLNQELTLHPVQANSVDEVVKQTTFDSATGTFVVPGRTTAVFVIEQTYTYFFPVIAKQGNLSAAAEPMDVAAAPTAVTPWVAVLVMPAMLVGMLPMRRRSV
ncbi:MAG: pullulanase-type alpha-1,6-glucosidase [Chloroflexi bacterium]|nr:pullulanase-type alpha-1,6-glucosidase [Chloroflexota bacterium]